MKTTLTTILAFLLLLVSILITGVSVLAQPPKTDPPPVKPNALPKEDEQAIHNTVKSIEKAWNAHDMKAYGQLFREDAEFINVVGMHWRGRDALLAAHIAFHETTFKNHTLKTDTVEVRSLGSGHAIAVVTTTNDAFTTPGGQVIPKRQNLQTYVFVKGPDGWKITHGHNVAVDPAAAKHDPVSSPKK